jgi:hypothetical protein
VLTAIVPPGLGDATLFALVLAENPHLNTLGQHHFGEGGNGTAVVAGTIGLGLPALPDGSWSGWGSAAAQVDPQADGMSISFAFTGTEIVVRPDSGAAAEPVPVIVDPETAAHASAGTLSLIVNATSPIPARIVAIAPRFPTLGEHFVVAADTTLANAVDQVSPGAGGAMEVWLAMPTTSLTTFGAAIDQAPYDQLSVNLRADRLAALIHDPLARGAATLLLANALIGLVMTALAVTLLVVAERRDDAAELYAWETDGLTPTQLRRSMFARAATVIAIGVPGGIGIGLALAALTARLIAVTAGGGSPVPPLSAAPVAGAGVWAMTGGVLACLPAAALAAAVALRDPRPRRPEDLVA